MQPIHSGSWLDTGSKNRLGNNGCLAVPETDLALAQGPFYAYRCWLRAQRERETSVGSMPTGLILASSYVDRNAAPEEQPPFFSVCASRFLPVFAFEPVESIRCPFLASERLLLCEGNVVDPPAIKQRPGFIVRIADTSVQPFGACVGSVQPYPRLPLSCTVQQRHKASCRHHPVPPLKGVLQSNVAIALTASQTRIETVQFG